MTAHSRCAAPATRRKLRPMVACALALPALLFSGCKQAAAPPALVTVQAEHPEQGPIAQHIEADAVLTPIAQAAIVPKITAPVKQFYVQRGSRVHAGELLAVLDNSGLKGAALDSQGAYEAAQGAYATATRAQIPEQVQAAEVAVAQAKANLSLDRNIVQSRTQLFAQGAIPGQLLDASKTALVQAQGAYDTAVKHLQFERSVNRAAALKEAQGQLTSAQGQYENAEAQLSYSEIRSPIDGVVTERPWFAGETASPGTPLLTVMDTSTLIAKAHIAEDLAQELKVGGEATVLVPGVAKPVPAKVALISPALDPGSTTVEVWLKIDNRSGMLRVGAPAHVTITGRTAAQALKIPLSAVLTAQDGSKSVMVVVSGAAQPKAVELGINDGQNVQVLSGLTPSDLVITSGSFGLDPGTKVKVGPADAGSAAAGNSAAAGDPDAAGQGGGDD